MDNNIKIRRASKKDLNIIREIALNVWPQTYAEILSPQQIDYMMDRIYSERSLVEQMDASHQFIIIYNQGIPVGFASYNEIEKNIYKLQKLYVLASEQGHGTGRFIIDYILSELKSCNAKALRLNVNRFNKARSFYEKLGFEIISSEDIDIGNGFFMNDFIMQKKL
ncbi:MAG: GNAT family N-acetyltransferase [Flavisolibacter sp.]